MPLYFCVWDFSGNFVGQRDSYEAAQTLADNFVDSTGRDAIVTAEVQSFLD